jgi:uncharacterized protein YecT (DUF1311 family)
VLFRSGRNSAPQVVLVIAVYEEVENLLRGGNLLDPGDVVLSAADGDFFAGLQLQPWSDGDEMRVALPPEKIAPLLAALAKSKTLTISRKSRPIASIALSEAGALLAHIDRIQGRKGDLLALPASKKKELPAAFVPADLPRVELPAYAGKALSPRVPADVARLWLQACEGDGELTAEGQPDRSFEGFDLGDGTAFWLIQCSSGAYSTSSFAFVVGPDGARQISHEDAGSDGSLELSGDEIGDPVIRFGKIERRNGENDAAGGEGPLVVRSYARGRGIGDCGAISEFGFDGQALRLISSRRMDICRGQTRDWPTFWRTVVATGPAPAPESRDTGAKTAPDAPWRLTDEMLSIPFRECIDQNAGEEAPMRACVKEELAIWDGRLNAAYKALKGQFASGETGVVTAGAVDKLKAAQRAWISVRDQTCSLEGAMHGGGLASYWQDMCRLRQTAVRAGFLESMVQGGD